MGTESRAHHLGGAANAERLLAKIVESSSKAPART